MLWCITVFFICYTSSSNGESSSQQSGAFSSLLINIISFIRGEALSSGEINTIHFEIRKFIGHFSLFLINGLLSLFILKFYYKKRMMFLYLMIFGIFLASLSETLQYFAGGRTFAINDILLDFFGYTFPIILFYYLSFVSSYYLQKI